MANSYENLVRENWNDHEVFILLTSVCMCLTWVVWCMRPQVSLSLHLEGLVRMRESLIIHAVSHLVFMVIHYQSKTVECTQLRIFFASTLIAIRFFVLFYPIKFRNTFAFFHTKPFNLKNKNGSNKKNWRNRLFAISPMFVVQFSLNFRCTYILTLAIILWCQKWIITESESVNPKFGMYKHNGPRPYTKYYRTL